MIPLKKLIIQEESPLGREVHPTYSKSYLWKWNRIEEDEFSVRDVETEEVTKNGEVEIMVLPSRHLEP